ncbi:MAG: FlgD immunoglobulin-like domain containing protein [bacterium]
MKTLYIITFVLTVFSGIFAVQWIRGPYLTNMKVGDVTIHWVTDAHGGYVEWGETEEYGKVSQPNDWDEVSEKFVYMDTAQAINNKLRLHGLKPGTEYFYKVTGDGLEERAGTFTTFPMNYEKKIIIGFVSDWDFPEDYHINWIEQNFGTPTVMIDLGDNATRGWSGIVDKTDTWMRRIPLALAWGNHDNDSSSPHEVAENIDYDGDRLHYNLHIGPAHFVIRGWTGYSDPYPDSLKSYFKRSFELSGSPWKFEGAHGSHFTTGPHEGEYVNINKPLWPAIVASKVQMCFGAHDHLMMVSHCIDKDSGVVSNGQGTYVCIPAGGSYTFHDAYWARKQAGESGMGVLVIDDNGQHANTYIATRTWSGKVLTLDNGYTTRMDVNHSFGSLSISDSSYIYSCMNREEYWAELFAEGGINGRYWSVSGGELPPGLVLSSDGVITGYVADEAQTRDYTFTAQVKDGAGNTDTKQFTINNTNPSMQDSIVVSAASKYNPGSKWVKYGHFAGQEHTRVFYRIPNASARYRVYAKISKKSYHPMTQAKFFIRDGNKVLDIKELTIIAGEKMLIGTYEFGYMSADVIWDFPKVTEDDTYITYGDIIFEFIELVNIKPSVKSGEKAGVLLRNIPNPMRGGDAIHLQVQQNYLSNLQITAGLYDIQGRLVRSLYRGNPETGSFTITWDGMDENAKKLSSGNYFLRISAGLAVEIRNLLIIN